MSGYDDERRERDAELLELAAQIDAAMHDLGQLCEALRYDEDKAVHVAGVAAEVARATERRAERMMSVIQGEG